MSSQSRALAYSLVSVPLFRLPDEGLLSQVRSQEFADALEAVERGLPSEGVREGIALIRDWISDASGPEVLDDLARDRTYLFRALAPGVGAPPPYESFWHRSASTESTMADIADAYRQASVSVASSAHERVDYLGVELMFMMRLIARELDGDRRALEATRAREAAFFFGHVDSWVAEYVHAALPLAESGFFKGLLQVLLALVEGERSYLKDAAA